VAHREVLRHQGGLIISLDMLALKIMFIEVLTRGNYGALSLGRVHELLRLCLVGGSQSISSFREGGLPISVKPCKH